MKRSYLILYTLLLLVGSLAAQNEHDSKFSSIGIGYFGELGFRPGLSIDYGLPIWQNISGSKKYRMFHGFEFRPEIAYYHYPHYSNNFSLSVRINYRIGILNSKNGIYVLFEPSLKTGFLFYALQGEKFQTTSSGFDEKSYGSTHSFILGNGADFTGYISPKFDWLLGFDYYTEFSEDKLVLPRFVAKLGTRLKFTSKKN